MGIPLFILAVSLMFSGVHGISESMSCSTGPDGKMICNKERSQGNAAMSSSSSSSGPGYSSQKTYAGAGDPNGQWQSSGQTVNGGSPGGFFNPFSGFAYPGSQEATGGFDCAGYPRPDYSYSYPSRGFTNDYSSYDYQDYQAPDQTPGYPRPDYSYSYPSRGFTNDYSYDYQDYQAPDQTPAYEFPSGGYSNSYDDTSTPSSGSFAGPLPGGVGAFAGGFSNVYDDSPSYGSNFGSFAGPLPGGGAAFAGGFASAGFNPMSFVPNVRSFVGPMAGGAGSFGFASAGGFPFLQPGIAYPPQDDEPSGGSAPRQGSNNNNGPMDFVNTFMNGAFGGGFGRR